MPIPMPEGTYRATWEKSRYEQRHVRWPGTWRDRVKLNDRPATFSIDEIPGGIPSWGKGESRRGIAGWMACSASRRVPHLGGGDWWSCRIGAP